MVKASVGTSVPSLLGKEALLDFKMDVSLDGESLSEAELGQFDDSIGKMIESALRLREQQK